MTALLLSRYEGENQLFSGTLTIGTRGSPLALFQAHLVRDKLIAAHHLDPTKIEIKTFKTEGDRIVNQPLYDFGGKGLFTKEIEDALLVHDIDIAVHSMKDMPTVLPSGLSIECLLPREDVRDAFISLSAKSLEDLPDGAVVGTSSLRRQAQLKRLRPDLEIIPYRGNVGTRLRKLEEGIADATLLATAGLKRLGLEKHITSVIETDQILPAIAQGAIGLEIEASNEPLKVLLAPLHDLDTAICVGAERAFLARLDGSCQTPIAGLAELREGRLHFRGMILSPDGKQAYAAYGEAGLGAGTGLATDIAEQLLGEAGDDFLEKGTLSAP